MPRNQESDEPMWKRIRNAVAGGTVFRLNLGDPRQVDQSEYGRKLLSDGVGTISDWGLANNADTALADDGVVISPDTLYEPFGDPLKGQINWDKLRDTLHTEFYSDRSTKVKAGQVAGTIRMFAEDMSEGDIILGNFAVGIIPGQVSGPAIYDRTTEYSEMAPNHCIYREVDWAGSNDSPLSVSQELLPPGFGPGRRTVERVNDPSPIVELLRPIEWIAQKL